MPQKKISLLVTGGAGFIGSEFVRNFAHKYKITIVDKITYAGDLKRLDSVRKHIKFYKTDICQKNKLRTIFQKEKPSVVIHFAAETHVDRSIQNAEPFIQTNVTGTQNLIDLARERKIKRFVHISTDEIYGESRSGKFLESSPHRPGNPYSSTKCAAELLILAAVRTFQFPAVIIRPANNYGPWQYPEKFVPVIIFKALHNKKIPVYGKGQQIREWLHVNDCAKAIHVILKKGKIGEAYNIGSYFEQPNIVTVKKVLKILDKPQTLIQFVKDRPGHDFRYSVHCGKLRKLGWRPQMTFHKGINQTIAWYTDNVKWVEKKLDYLESYWKRVYKPKTSR